MKLTLACAVVALLPLSAACQIYDTNGDFCQTVISNLNQPVVLTVDKGSVLIDESGASEILNYPGLSVAAGSGPLGSGGGMACDTSGNIWLAGDVAPVATVTRIESSGSIESTNFSDGMIVGDEGVCVDSFGNAYVSDQRGFIYQFDTNLVRRIIAGADAEGYTDLPGALARFSAPNALACDAAGNVYVWDFGNRLIRRIDSNGNVSTVAGSTNFWENIDGQSTNAGFQSIEQMCFDSFGNLILACDKSVRMVAPSGFVSTLAGSFTEAGAADGPGSAARFEYVRGVCVSGGTIYASDEGNGSIVAITNNAVHIVQPSQLSIASYVGVSITGTVGRAYSVQSSPDMATWTTRATLILRTSPYLWIDAQPIAGNKFYRALLLP